MVRRVCVAPLFCAFGTPPHTKERPLCEAGRQGVMKRQRAVMALLPSPQTPRTSLLPQRSETRAKSPFSHTHALPHHRHSLPPTLPICVFLLPPSSLSLSPARRNVGVAIAKAGPPPSPSFMPPAQSLPPSLPRPFPPAVCWWRAWHCPRRCPSRPILVLILIYSYFVSVCSPLSPSDAAALLVITAMGGRPCRRSRRQRICPCACAHCGTPPCV